MRVVAERTYKILLEANQDELQDLVDALTYNNGDSDTAVWNDTMVDLRNDLAALITDSNKMP